MGKILEGTSLAKHISKQEEIIDKAQKEISNIKNSNIGTAKGQAKKIRTQKAIINNTQKQMKPYKIVNDITNKTATSAVSTLTTGIYNANKDENKNKENK